MRPKSAPHLERNEKNEKKEKKERNERKRDTGNLNYFLNSKNFEINQKKHNKLYNNDDSNNSNSSNNYNNSNKREENERKSSILSLKNNKNHYSNNNNSNNNVIRNDHKNTTFLSQKLLLTKKITNIHDTYSKLTEEQVRQSKVWKSISIKDVYPYPREIRYLEEKAIEFKEDPEVIIEKEATLLERMKTISDGYVDVNSDGEDSLEEDAKRNIEGKFSFRLRLHHVLEAVQRESPTKSELLNKNSTFQTTSYRNQQKIQNFTQFTNNTTNFVSSRKTYNVFEPQPNEEFQEDNSDNKPDDQSITSSIPLSQSTFTEDSNLKNNMNSPRAAMIQEGHKRHQIPFVVKELVGNVDVDQISTINLAGQGIGDEKMNCLVRSLPYFIHVDEINISNNRLTDISLKPFLNTILGKLPCTILDISANKMDGESIDMLKEHLLRDECELKELRFKQSDIDDSECAEIMQSMLHNKTLTSLNLSDNQIGVKEDLNAAKPSFVTGGEAIADMLLQNRTLTELNVSWNSIRGESAVVLGQSIAQNNTLKIINLAYNNLGDEGAQQLAHSLRFNLTIEDIDISYNNISPKTALVFAQVFSQNISVTQFNVNGNCLGKIGSRELLRAVRMAASDKRILKIEMDGCNITYEDDTFDRNNASGTYELDLSNTYGYAVACILYELANTKSESKFVHVQHGTKNPAYEKFVPSKTFQKSPPEHIWKDVILKRGPSQAEISRNMWTTVLSDIQTTRTELATPKKSTKKHSTFRRRYEKVPSYDIGEEWDHFKEEREKERNRLKDALQKILTNFEMFPENDVLNELIDHFHLLSNPDKNEVHLILKQVFLKIFEIAWHTSIAPTGVSQEGGLFIKRSNSYTEDDNIISVQDVARIIIALGWKNLDTQKASEMAKKIVKSCDVYNQETISRGDFVRFMFTYFTDTFASSPGPLIDNKTGCPWEVPTKGLLSINFQSANMPPTADSIATDDTIKILTSTTDNYKKSEKNTEKKPLVLDRGALKNSVIDEDFYITSEQAEILLNQFQQDNQSPVIHTVELLLPQLASPKDACRFLASNLSFEQIGILRDRLQNFYRAATGISSGHYILDLSKKYDRLAVKKLVEQCNLEKAKRSTWKYPHLNTSQNGLNESFRNASFNNKPLELTTSWFDEIPETGKLIFDYVNLERPVPGMEPISEHFFHRLLRETLFVQDTEGAVLRKDSSGSEFSFDIEPVSRFSPMNGGKKIQKRTEASKFSSVKRNSTSHQNKNILAEQASRQIWTSFIETTWTTYVERHTQNLFDTLREAKKSAALKRGFKGTNTPDQPTQNSNEIIENTNQPKNEIKDKRKLKKKIQEPSLSFSESKIVNHAALYSHQYREARSKPVYLAETGIRPTEGVADMRHTLQRATDFIQQPDRIEGIMKKCMMYENIYRTLEVLLVYQLYFSAEQIEELLKKLTDNYAPIHVIVRCFQLLFFRIIDLENCHKILYKMKLFEREEVYHRVGFLNVWNPMEPDSDYKLYLSSWEQREVAKILFRLAVVEPGDNLLEQNYQQSVIEEYVPGWELPLSWTNEITGSETKVATNPPPTTQINNKGKGNDQPIDPQQGLQLMEGHKLPKYGIVSFVYTSDPASGCQADIPEREHLTKTRTLINYQGKFIDSISASNKRRAQNIPQSAIRFVGDKLRRLTLKGQDSFGLGGVPIDQNIMKNYRRKYSRMGSNDSRQSDSRISKDDRFFNRNDSLDSNNDEENNMIQLSRQKSYPRTNSTPLAVIEEN